MLKNILKFILPVLLMVLFLSGASMALAASDCSSKLKGVCLDSSNAAEAAVIQGYLDNGWVTEAGHCPGSSTNICYYDPNKVSPTTLPQTTASVSLSPSKCCSQIVPPLDLEHYNYGLNHIVQVGVNIYQCILCIVGALILMMLVIGAVVLLISAGNETRVAAGKKIISSAVIGGIIVFFSFLIVNFTVKALGASFANENAVNISPGK